MYGTRAVKYATLDAESVATTAWAELAPGGPGYYFVPEAGTLRDEYERGWTITEAMPVNSVGIATARDVLAIQFMREDVWNTVNEFASISEMDARERFHLGRDAEDWRVTWAMTCLGQTEAFPSLEEIDVLMEAIRDGSIDQNNPMIANLLKYIRDNINVETV